jgi:hypothetical protein
MLSAYGEKLIEPASKFPTEMENRINVHLRDGSVKNNTLDPEVLQRMDTW